MLDLVSVKTGKPFQIVSFEEAEQAEPATEPVQASTEQAPTEEAIRKLDAIAERILMPQQSYTVEEVQQLIEATLKLSSDRAKAGTQKMIDFGAIQPTWNNRYYLRDSTAF
jgi:LAS superfamily LD-carboxypeptidase LdcB